MRGSVATPGARGFVELESQTESVDSAQYSVARLDLTMQPELTRREFAMTGYTTGASRSMRGRARITLVILLIAALFAIAPPADAAPVVLVVESDGSTSVDEDGGTDTYTVALEDPPTTDVVVTLAADGQVDGR